MNDFIDVVFIDAWVVVGSFADVPFLPFVPPARFRWGFINIIPKIIFIFICIVVSTALVGLGDKYFLGFRSSGFSRA